MTETDENIHIKHRSKGWPKISQVSIVYTQTVLGGLTIYPPVANFP